jgi:SpoVK/Ycf46/Vps4 family AAA+-type ATPase
MTYATDPAADGSPSAGDTPNLPADAARLVAIAGRWRQIGAALSACKDTDEILLLGREREALRRVLSPISEGGEGLLDRLSAADWHAIRGNAGARALAAEVVRRTLPSAAAFERTAPPIPPIDLNLFVSNFELGTVLDRVAGVTGRLGVLIHGPSGAGKSALALTLAAATGLPIVSVRADDVLRAHVGATESALAAILDECRRRGAALAIDEVDGLAFDRGRATHAWEVSQVDALLRLLDEHDRPWMFTTNLPHLCDPALVRRCPLKISLNHLDPPRARRAFARFFRADPPAELDDLAFLTPSDFVTVKERLAMLGIDATPLRLLDELRRETALKPEAVGLRPGVPRALH